MSKSFVDIKPGNISGERIITENQNRFQIHVEWMLVFKCNRSSSVSIIVTIIPLALVSF